ncbi:MAG: glycosyltransferase [Verrucomicrobia bacterium]|nr:glycosyltransferase [Verrucomicrobiota bacterium]
MCSRPTTADRAFSRRFTSYAGLFHDDFHADSAWVRDQAVIRLPPLTGVAALVVTGEHVPHPEAVGLEAGCPGLRLAVNGRTAAFVQPTSAGPWEARLPVPTGERLQLTFDLTGVGWTNTLAWAGRVTGFAPWQRFRRQNRNRQLRIRTLATEAGECLYDFSRRDSPFAPAYFRSHARLGLNIVGFLTADLGVGESARCMVRAADAAGLPSALVALRLPCKNRLGDTTFAHRLQTDNPHGVNVIHLDPPAARDLDHHHGRDFRAGRYNIGYFAWELPEFPDAWLPSFEYFDEIWCPSDFTAAAVREKSPLPVLTFPHAVAFPRPAEEPAVLRQRFGLPPDRFLFLSLFDLNSYAARKNPRAVLAAYRAAALGPEAGLVLKVQNVAGNEADFAALEAEARNLPGTILLTETLSRTDLYALEAACDSFVSLHRSEGFGLAVAECMYLGKPVISTHWSATAEYVQADNGCPVRASLVTLERNHGPYPRGGTWADPDPLDAAASMRRLVRDRGYAAQLGAAARASIEERFHPATIGARYRRRLESIAMF